MSPALAANAGPVSARPGTQLHAQNWLITLTEPVPDRCRLVLGDPVYGQMVYVEECTGTGPYVCRLTYAIGKHHPAGTPVTVDSLMDQPLGVMTEQPDTDAVTYVTAADYGRLQAALDAPGVPNGRIRREAEGVRAEAGVSGLRHGIEPTPDRDGYTIGVYLPPGVPEAERDRVFDAVADAAHAAEGGGWTVDVSGTPGDPAGIRSPAEG